MVWGQVFRWQSPLCFLLSFYNAKKTLKAQNILSKSLQVYLSFLLPLFSLESVSVEYKGKGTIKIWFSISGCPLVSENACHLLSAPNDLKISWALEAVYSVDLIPSKYKGLLTDILLQISALIILYDFPAMNVVKRGKYPGTICVFLWLFQNVWRSYPEYVEDIKYKPIK